jgi:hypothetical protein
MPKPPNQTVHRTVGYLLLLIGYSFSMIRFECFNALLKTFKKLCHGKMIDEIQLQEYNFHPLFGWYIAGWM